MDKPTALLWAQGCREVLHPLSVGSFQLLVLEQGPSAPSVRGWKAAASASFQSSLQSAFKPPSLAFIFVIFKKEQTSGFPCAWPCLWPYRMVNLSSLNSSIPTGTCEPQIGVCKGDCYCRERTLNLLAGKVQCRQSQEEEPAGGVAGPLLLPVPALPLQAHVAVPQKVLPCPPLLSPEGEQQREQDAADRQALIWRDFILGHGERSVNESV